MNYIEENFINYGTHLTDEEIEVLKTFIERLKNNLLVEGIYIIPTHYSIEYNHDEYDEVKIIIHIIINDTARYNMMTYKDQVPNKEHNLKIIQYIIDEFKYRMDMVKYTLNEYEVSHHIGNSINFIFESESTIQHLSNEQLICSYIIFDRYGYYSKLQEKLKDIYVCPYDNLVKIRNIEKLDKPYVKRK